MSLPTAVSRLASAWSAAVVYCRAFPVKMSSSLVASLHVCIGIGGVGAAGAAITKAGMCGCVVVAFKLCSAFVLDTVLMAANWRPITRLVAGYEDMLFVGPRFLLFVYERSVQARGRAGE